MAFDVASAYMAATRLLMAQTCERPPAIGTLNLTPSRGLMTRQPASSIHVEVPLSAVPSPRMDCATSLAVNRSKAKTPLRSL